MEYSRVIQADLVRSSCAEACEKLKDFVQIHLEKFDLNTTIQPPLWDEFDWHCSTKIHGDIITARYIFVLDSLNYCFWPNSSKTGLEYEHLARGLRIAHEKNGDQFLDLKNCTEERIKSWLESPHEFPLLSTRVEAIQSLGEALEKYGDAIEWVKEANESGVKLVDLIFDRLPKFRDETKLGESRIVFCKRAQILVADIWAAFGQKTQGLGGFYDMDQLTMFADYRVPQLLREMGVLVYSEQLASKIDSGIHISAGSKDEIAIRAASVHVVELLRNSLIGNKLKSVEVDWLLWQHAEKTKHDLRPNHKTLTIYY